ncbi:2,3-bisphosphoglycerate-independent phosphoglycerate mutase [Sneathiella chungangensis]|uniref:2,3-bisphosphoglycerate-independent phosphoglycerate mutase n=1 Tax=Sneathiella chungangensis TaxID=1418234 RepID=A0A845MJ75_9PROT|nr:2,3-bisphosphoglycerate-independent phosphoglycerate mutase [Sneathiella chungangensis]MZR23682.1 2,3-bisphosphoglycerate-independent phosphoglycerate mutase [Sneathiella chungangensis]
MKIHPDHSRNPRPVVLCILDGWGHSESGIDSAIASAKTPNWDHMLATRPHSLLSTSGADVGLPDGQMGNSEVGHMTIGSGRIILQDLPRINREIETGELAENPELLDAIAKLKASGGSCHIAGLLSPGGVHSHQDHMAALAKIMDDAGIETHIHGFMDGRDTPPTSGATYIRDFGNKINALGKSHVATLVGRYFAMDRDTNWDRVETAYDAIFGADGIPFTDPVAALEAAYAKGKTDEFIKPLVADGYSGVKDGDAFIMANFRADRAREILTAITDNGFTGFDRKKRPELVAVKGMVEYSSELAKSIPALFPPVDVRHTLGEMVASAGKTQLRIAETEKYAHVTFFLNGGEEKVYQGEERILVPSPKVATYDLKPEMSAFEVLDELTKAVGAQKFDMIVVNFANPDMVGHTGVMEAAIKAVEVIDECIGKLANAVEKAGGAMLITADHGNIELMRDPETHAPYTSHTTNLVPLVLAVGAENVWLGNGTLADLAPTVLTLMGLDIPSEMTGTCLIKEREGLENDRVAS